MVASCVRYDSPAAPRPGSLLASGGRGSRSSRAKVEERGQAGYADQQPASSGHLDGDLTQIEHTGRSGKHKDGE
jgi:hypothetical protein